MKERLYRFVAVALLIVPLAVACNSRERAQQGGADDTATIAPAEAQPAPTGNEAMTQTVDIESGRSDAEGGAITDPAPGSPAPTATAGTDTMATAPATGAAAVAKGRNAPPVQRNRTQ